MTSHHQEAESQFIPPGLNHLEDQFSQRKLRKLFDDSAEGIKHYYLGSLYPGIYFTPQEARCMFYFLQYFTNQQVAVCLNLSDRTVGSYASNMQRKLRLRNKREMIDRVRKTDFLKYFFEKRMFSGH